MVQLRKRKVSSLKPSLKPSLVKPSKPYAKSFNEVCSISKDTCKTISSARGVTYTFEHKGTRSLTLCDGENLIPLVMKPLDKGFDVYLDGFLVGKAHQNGGALEIGWGSHDPVLEHEAALTLTALKKKKKRKISKTLKDLLWTQWVGETKATAPCYCCQERGSHTIYMRSFEAAHILSVANGGDDSLENMRPSCGRCNRGTATKSMDEFQTTILNFKTTVSDPGYHASYMALE